MGLKICSFASGSKGNCCYISDGETDLLIDLGISALAAERCLKAVGANPDRIAVAITHAHSDHIGGLKVFCKKHAGATLLCQRECATGINYFSGVRPTVVERVFSVGTLTVRALPVSHDVPCFGYVVESGGRSVAVMTDVGVVTTDALGAMCGCGVVMIEANHDPDKLRANPKYTPVLKARISSDRGHLSNGDCASACAYLAKNGVRSFILAHLSEENNEPELAVAAVKRGLESSGVAGARVIAATQNSMTGLYEVC